MCRCRRERVHEHPCCTPSCPQARGQLRLLRTRWTAITHIRLTRPMPAPVPYPASRSDGLDRSGPSPTTSLQMPPLEHMPAQPAYPKDCRPTSQRRTCSSNISCPCHHYRRSRRPCLSPESRPQRPREPAGPRVPPLGHRSVLQTHTRLFELDSTRLPSPPPVPPAHEAARLSVSTSVFRTWEARSRRSLQRRLFSSRDQSSLRVVVPPEQTQAFLHRPTTRCGRRHDLTPILSSECLRIRTCSSLVPSGAAPSSAAREAHGVFTVLGTCYSPALHNSNSRTPTLVARLSNVAVRRRPFRVLHRWQMLLPLRAVFKLKWTPPHILRHHAAAAPVLSSMAPHARHRSLRVHVPHSLGTHAPAAPPGTAKPNLVRKDRQVQPTALLHFRYSSFLAGLCVVLCTAPLRRPDRAQSGVNLALPTRLRLLQAFGFSYEARRPFLPFLVGACNDTSR